MAVESSEMAERPEMEMVDALEGMQPMQLLMALASKWGGSIFAWKGCSRSGGTWTRKGRR